MSESSRADKFSFWRAVNAARRKLALIDLLGAIATAIVGTLGYLLSENWLPLVLAVAAIPALAVVRMVYFLPGAWREERSRAEGERARVATELTLATLARWDGAIGAASAELGRIEQARSVLEQMLSNLAERHERLAQVIRALELIAPIRARARKIADADKDVGEQERFALARQASHACREARLPADVLREIGMTPNLFPNDNAELVAHFDAVTAILEQHRADPMPDFLKEARKQLAEVSNAAQTARGTLAGGPEPQDK